MILLTDEEMEKLLGTDFRTAHSGHIAEYHSVAKAQLKKVREWGTPLCNKDGHSGKRFNQPVWQCPECWQSLLEEVT